MIFSKIVFGNLKSVAFSYHLKNKLAFQVLQQKSYSPVNICKTAYSSQGSVKKHGFGANFLKEKF